MPSFLTVPGSNGDSQRGSISLGSSRGVSACSKTSQRSGSVLQLRTVVKMLAPVIWSNLEAKRKRENPNYKVRQKIYSRTTDGHQSEKQTV